jgi:16S rRNA (cytidine1402-2'-O)-methyltransferase
MSARRGRFRKNSSASSFGRVRSVNGTINSALESRALTVPGTLFVVATPIGNLEDITLRALRVLREATVIAAEDTRRTAHLLARHAIATPTTSLHEHNEGQKSAALVARLQRGEHVALVSDAGTPTVSDPGHRLIRAAIQAGVRVEPLPGPSAAVAAIAASGFCADTFTFLGFPPTRSKDRKQWLERVRTACEIVVFFEAPHRIRGTLEQLQLLLGDRQLVVGRELTKAHEELVRGHVSSVLERLGSPRGEFTVVVDVGHTTESVPVRPLSDEDTYAEFSRLTSSERFTRRQAIAAIARKHQLAPNDVYAAIERWKNLAK